MYARFDPVGDAGIINLGGRFDASGHQAFIDCCGRALTQEACRRIDIDLGAVDYLDSFALTMLLSLKERADRRGLPVSLLNCRGGVRQILDGANFGTLFTIR